MGVGKRMSQRSLILSDGSDERKLAEVSDNSSVVKLRENLRVQQKLLYSDDIKLVGKVCTVSKSDELQKAEIYLAFALMTASKRQNSRLCGAARMRKWLMQESSLFRPFEKAELSPKVDVRFLDSSRVATLPQSPAFALSLIDVSVSGWRNLRYFTLVLQKDA